MNKNLIILFIVFTLLTNLTTVLGQGETYHLPNPVRLNDCVELKQTCSTCTYNNISSISSPNETRILINVAMSQASGKDYVYEFCNNTEIGWWVVSGYGDIDGTLTTWKYDYLVTVDGKELTTQKSAIYIFVLCLSIGIFIGLLLFGYYLPDGNKKNQFTGYILEVSNLKYLKYVVFALAYINLIWISYFSWMIVYAYLDFNFLSSIFRFFFVFLVACTLPLFILFCYICITNLIRDTKIADYLSRGLRTNGNV